jgi:tetratricopeptide (TPR) repeat protein
LRLAEPTQSRKNIVTGWRLKGQGFLAQNKIVEAEEAMNKALAVAQEIGNPPQLWKTYAALGELHERKGDATQARVMYAHALQVIDEVASKLQDTELKRTFLGARQVQEIRHMV